MPFMETLSDIKQVVTSTTVDGTGWKIAAAIWASKALYVRHKEYLRRVIKRTASSRNAVRATVEQIVEYINGLKIESVIMDSLAMMADAQKTLVVYLALMELRATDESLTIKIPKVVLGEGNNYTLAWDDQLPQDQPTNEEKDNK